MNKGRRQELKRLHYKRRLKICSAKNASMKHYINGNSVPTNNHALRTTGKPCSCICCSPNKYDRAKVKAAAKAMADPVCELVISKTGVIRKSPYIPYIEGDEEEEDKMMEIWRECNFDD